MNPSYRLTIVLLATIAALAAFLTLITFGPLTAWPHWGLYVDDTHYASYSKEISCKMKAAEIAAHFIQASQPVPTLECRYSDGRDGQP